MFHTGDLNSGITLALQSRKSVACFVRDTNEESQKWEESWLQDEELARLLSQRAVVLRLEEGSQEAGFLGAFCPLKEVPALVVIHNGQLKEHIASPVDEDQFRKRLKAALDPGESIPNSASAQGPTPSITTPASTTTPTASTTTTTPTSPPTTSPPSRTPEQILAEHQARVEHERIAREARQKQEAAQAKQRAREEAAARQSQPQISPAESSRAKGKQKVEPPGLSERERQSAEAKRIQQTAAEEARKHKLAREKDLERVQARLRQDQEERRAHQRAREREREAVGVGVGAGASAGAGAARSTPSPRPQTSRTTSAVGKNVSLQVRLFDGSTVRKSFPSAENLTTAVRPWVDGQLEEAPPPYTFRHIQAPLPSREISMSEEASPLAELGLFPSATLVLVPVAGYTSAYASGQGDGYLGTVQRGTTGVFGLVGSAIGAVVGTMRAVPGLRLLVSPGTDGSQDGRASAPQQGRTMDQSSSSGAQGTQNNSSGSGLKIRTLADQRREAGRDDTELYNGNQLNFEPRDDDNK
ncbi:hypothetical protein EJ05DRAFT_476700 [Pseudovirgaria hyperparasitica]|uniref:UBX domain-containing protein 2 n=1 Tax=Pseudovirgaria hyperparasitica TaxID=470096 RepID=A0A6A6W658_9PEZI|nr:uncharacterized protein EJ05DRAFT_476700 [Pseudovirgaria hyperparasitica]KAF2757440.1 hypothetical protein EJ05DRAFT_476700 [Pseudovirgaria hyperparasitica]